MRVAGEDELVDAERVVLADSLRDLVEASDQRRAGAAAKQPDACPQVGVDLEPLTASAVERDHAPLTDGRLGGERALGRGDRRLVGIGEQRVAARQASSESARATTCNLSPKRGARPSVAANSLTCSTRRATAGGGSPQVR